MTLNDFLLARIAEDEDRARQAGNLEAFLFTDPSACRLINRDTDERITLEPQTLAEGLWLEHAIHHLPGRVLAECEAKRRIVHISRYAADRVPPKGDGYAEGRARQTLRLLALPYADHPDYDPEWTPNLT